MKHMDRIVLFYNKLSTGVSYASQTIHLLPLDRAWLQQMSKYKWPTRGLPTFTRDRSLLFSGLIRQYLFVSLYRAFAESMASENAARLASMQAAERNIKNTVDAFRMALNEQRQNAITDELLDIVSGFEALVNKQDH